MSGKVGEAGRQGDKAGVNVCMPVTSLQDNSNQKPDVLS